MDATFGTEIGRQALDQLGRTIAEVYDASLRQVNIAVTQARMPPLNSMSHEQLEAVRVAAPQVAEIVLFQLLAHLDWLESTQGPVRISVQVGDQVVENPGECSDQLAAELLLETGWLARFATEPAPRQEGT